MDDLDIAFQKFFPDAYDATLRSAQHCKQVREAIEPFMGKHDPCYREFLEGALAAVVHLAQESGHSEALKQEWKLLWTSAE